MNLLTHLRPTTLAQLIAEVITDHADEDSTGEFTFHTEEAAQAYRELLAAGEDNIHPLQSSSSSPNDDGNAHSQR